MKLQMLLAMFLIFLLASCDKENDLPADQLISPSDANALSQVIVMPAGTQSVAGNPPSPTGAGAPTVTNPNSTIVSSNGATSPLYFNYNGVNGNLGGCYVQIDGANSYFNIPYNSTSGASGQLTLPIGIPTNVDQGTFCVIFCVYDASGRVSNIVESCVELIRLGSGALQINLAWNNTSDQDLYVTTPDGDVIYYSNDFAQGGYLDRDDVDGYGPENVFWESDAPNGTYSVEVDDFTGVSGGTDFFITINAPGLTRSFTGRTQNGNKVLVTTFTKSGSSISF